MLMLTIEGDWSPPLRPDGGQGEQLGAVGPPSGLEGQNSRILWLPHIQVG